jgi:hypothetical protein
VASRLAARADFVKGPLRLLRDVWPYWRDLAIVLGAMVLTIRLDVLRPGRPSSSSITSWLGRRCRIASGGS